MSRWLVVNAVRLLFRLIARVTVVGRENLALAGPTIIAANHLGRLDALLILSLNEFTSHPNLIVVVAEKYRDYAIYRWAVKVMNFLWLDRFSGDLAALREVLRRLRLDGLMVIAPEGTRSPEEALIKAKPGAAYMAAKSGATVVPVGVTGTEDRLVKQALINRQRVSITMRIGKPFVIPPLPNHDREKFLEETSDVIMCHIAALLPPSHRGYYADHPVLVSLLKTGVG